MNSNRFPGNIREARRYDFIRGGKEMRKQLGMILVLGFLLNICINITAMAGEKVTVGFAHCDMTDKYLVYVADAMVKEASANNIEVVITDARNDSSIQLADVENFIMQGVDIIIYPPVDSKASQSVVDACRKAGVKLIGLVRPFAGANVYVGSDSTDAGIRQMEAMAEKMGYKGNIGLLQGALGAADQVMRTDGNKKIIAKYPDMKIVLEDTGKWQRADGMMIAENWIQADMNLNAIICNNDEMAIGTIEALRAAQNKNILVAGIDATKDALKYVETGELTVTLFQNPKRQAIEVVNAIRKIKSGEKVDANISVPFEVVDISNYKDYVKFWEEVE